MNRLGKLRVFVLRVLLGSLFAVLLTRVFRPASDSGYVAVFAVLLVFSAYLLETLRRP